MRAFALGFEQMKAGALGASFTDRPDPLGRFQATMEAIQGQESAPIAAQYFGGAARWHVERYGTKAETFARIAVKARSHAARNPLAVFRDPVTLEEVMASPTVFDPMTRLQCCSANLAGRPRGCSAAKASPGGTASEHCGGAHHGAGDDHRPPGQP